MELNDYFYCDVPVKSSWNYTYDVLPPIEEEKEMNGGDSINSELDNTDELICWGCGEFGQHGHLTKEDVSFQDGALQNIKNKVKAVSCGASHTLIVTNSDEVYSWGNGNSGQLGKEEASISQAYKVELFDTKSKNPSTSGVACGARHSMVWLQNGNVFSFGNNFYAQLGYDFREKNYKENQTKPYLLKFLVYKPVAQVACGEKHSVFRFQNGSIACVGSNAHGQIGMGNRMEAVVPKFLEMDDSINYVACGANHSMAVTDEGEIYLWGYGKACGDKTNDILTPERQMTRKKNVVQVAGGSNHSMALTASGSVYTWGSGSEGQLGFGDKVWFLSEPQRLVYKDLSKNIVDIACGDLYSAAVTENGELYMWGKNSHVIYPGKPTSLKIWLPHCVNKGKQPVKSVYCGSWHAAAITGFPDLLSCIDGDSGISDLEQENIVTTAPSTTTLMLRSVKINEKPTMDDQDEQHLSSDESEIDAPDSQRETTSFQREHTKQTLAEFYAPTPDIKKQYDVPSPSFYDDKDDGEVDKNYDIDDDYTYYGKENVETKSKAGSVKSAKLVVSVPHQRGAHDYVDVGTSPIPFSSSASESDQIESVKEVKVTKTVNKKTNKKKPLIANKPQTRESQYYEDNENNNTVPLSTTNYDRPKNMNNVPSSSYIQISKTTADSFMLPRENTTLTRTQIDFKEMDKIKQWTSIPQKPEKHPPRIGRIYDNSPVNRTIEMNSHARTYSESSTRHLIYADSPVSSRAGEASLHKVSSYSLPYGRIIDSPIGKSGRHSETAILNIMRQEQGLDRLPSKMMLRTSESSLADYGRSQNTPEFMDDSLSLKARLPPRPYHAPSMPKKNTELNFGLQISRNNTFIGPVKNSKTATNVNQFQRYANVHNPLANSTKKAETKNKLGLVTPRNVSIPASRVPVIQEEADNLCVHGLTGGKKARQPIYSSAASWRDKSDIEKIRAASRNKSHSASPHSSPSLESPDYKNIHENGGVQDINSDMKSYGHGEYDGLLVGQSESEAFELNSENKVSLTKRHEKQNNIVSTFQLDSHIDLDSELTDLKMETNYSKGFHNRKNGLFPASISQTS